MNNPTLTAAAMNRPFLYSAPPRERGGPLSLTMIARIMTSQSRRLPALMVVLACGLLPLRGAMVETGENLKDLPAVPPGFEVTLYARDPLVRNPCSMAFDSQGRLFIGMGPQYRNPKPATPPDSVVLVRDTDGDGVADQTHVFATGFNCIQGLAWHGRDLWVANAPDLTLVRDTNGDDVADEYVRIYTDLGNIEHGLHGLNWGPDGKLYMSKGNSKGRALNGLLKDEPGRLAPQAFRELWGLKPLPGAPAIPPPATFSPASYRSTYHDPRDDWGQMGGVLRCDDLGANLEIISRGLRNPWDIAFDAGFHWLGTDNDQNQGDRIFMPFYGADFGWGHRWSAGWTGENHLPTVPISGPVFAGSGTGIVYADAPGFPTNCRKVWIINDWLNKITYLYRPVWEGSLLQPAGGRWEEFIDGRGALYRPTDLEFGPDGALYVLGWGRGYGVELDQDGQMSNEGRIFRIAPRGTPTKAPAWKPVAQRDVPGLLEDLGAVVPARRVAAQDELVRRGVKEELVTALKGGALDEGRETWAAWALLRQGGALPQEVLQRSANLALQDLRARSATAEDLQNPDARFRLAALTAAHQRRQDGLTRAVVERLAVEDDRLCFYAAWNALADLLKETEARLLLKDPRATVRRGAFLALMKTGALQEAEILALSKDKDEAMRGLVSLALGKDENREAEAKGEPAYPLATNLQAKSKKRYATGTLRQGGMTYTDRRYVFKAVPALLDGACMIQTVNADDRSTADDFLRFETPLDVQVHVALDVRISTRPAWMREFTDSDLTIANDDTTYHVWTKNFPAGTVTLGGNADAGAPQGARSQYFVVLQPRPMTPPGQAATAEAVTALLGQGNARRGEALFHAAGAAGCGACHRVGGRGVVFGPELTGLGARMETKYMVQSILEPNAAITEGFSAHVVEAEGKSWFGVLAQESGDQLTLALPGGRKQKVAKKTITRHEIIPASPMPPMAALLSAQDVADLVAYLKVPQDGTVLKAEPGVAGVAKLGFETEGDLLHIRLGQVRLASYMMKSGLIRRPAFINLRTVRGVEVTRPFPVREKDPKKGGDHPDMHPGVWLGFGDVNGTDFWRNQGAVEHVKFLQKPGIENGVAGFTTLNRFVTAEGVELGHQILKAVIRPQAEGWRLSLETTLDGGEGELSLGAQEEMGLGVRMAGPWIEKSGGLVISSLGDRGARAAWGKEAAWWDYSGPGGGPGALLAPAPTNPLTCWGHTRDYGVMVANITPRDPPKNRTSIPAGKPLRLRFELLIHDAAIEPAAVVAEWFR